ncbi:MAG: PD40 domain-containing protein [Anaerolineales bacterium]|nr:PD40 domain-containing protein [Anaerolineales bacterium]
MKRQHVVGQVLGLAGLLLAACGGGATTAAPTVEVPIIAATATATALPVGADTPWKNLGLGGHLLFSLGEQGIHYLDLATAEARVIFALPEGAWLTAVSASAGGQSLALAYAPPPAEGEVQLGYTAIYELPGECLTRGTPCTPDDLTPLVERVDPHEAYFSPLWAPDGQYLYFAHFTPSDNAGGSSFTYTMERLPMAADPNGGAASATGAAEVILNDGLWPALSADGTQLVYVYSDPRDYTNSLNLAAADGADVRQLTAPKDFTAVDAPLFTLDGQTVIFSAVGEGPAAAVLSRPFAWLDALTGATAAEAAPPPAPPALPPAHSVPSDWWSIPVGGGSPRRLSNRLDTGMFGDLAPDGRYMAYISASGLYVLPVTGGEPVKLLDVSGSGSLEWLP